MLSYDELSLAVAREAAFSRRRRLQPIESPMRQTRHAENRMRDRGVRQDFLDLLLANADLEADVGGGSTLYRVSRETAAALRVGDKLARYGTILTGDAALRTGGRVVSQRVV